MPEHRAGTPDRLAGLESFLWHNFDAGREDWRHWLRRKMPDVDEDAGEAAFDGTMQLHGALRTLQAKNSGLEAVPGEADGEAFNRLVDACAIRPLLAPDDRVVFVANRPEEPLARILLWALEAMQADQWRRFKLCRDPACRASYYDASKAAAKSWCSMDTCGSRNKMRRYRARS